MNKNYIGSDFDDFLAEEGLLEETETTAVKRVLAYQISELMKEKKISKAEMARRMKTSRAALERLLDPENSSVTLQTMDKAAQSLGKHLRLTLVT
ncbi:MAG: helix-turn-helix transcriptional regulator [Anaerolineaceae bacterium]|nr:helix-turn-helix transcriptional regulator [Anaerolineaceae bacterium]